MDVLESELRSIETINQNKALHLSNKYNRHSETLFTMPQFAL